MTEQEIVDVLKENKTKGIAYLFLPEDVWEWIGENLNNPKLLYLAPNGKWEFFSETDFDDFDNIVFALPDYYQVKQEPKGEWVEFDIDKNGDFEIGGIANDKNSTVIYNWSQWNKPIRDNASKNFINGCCAFGGWQYKDSKRWYLAPAVKLQDEDGDLWNSYIIEFRGEAIPAVPTKIRFWKESR